MSIFSFLRRIWKWKEKRTKKNLTFPDGDLNPRFLNKFPPKIWILREIRSIELTVLKKSRLYVLTIFAYLLLFISERSSCPQVALERPKMQLCFEYFMKRVEALVRCRRKTISDLHLNLWLLWNFTSKPTLLYKLYHFKSSPSSSLFLLPRPRENIKDHSLHRCLQLWTLIFTQRSS